MTGQQQEPPFWVIPLLVIVICLPMSMCANYVLNKSPVDLTDIFCWMYTYPRKTDPDLKEYDQICKLSHEERKKYYKVRRTLKLEL